MAEDSTHTGRLDRVEGEVAIIRTEMGDLRSEVASVKSDIRGLAGILGRIEDSVKSAQSEQIEREQRSRINPVALAAVLITIITALLTGSWVISAALASADVRVSAQEQSIERMEQRQWDARHAAP